jgi:hypothetical protein
MGWVFSTPYMPPALILLSNLVVPLFYNNEASAGKTCSLEQLPKKVRRESHGERQRIKTASEIFQQN